MSLLGKKGVEPRDHVYQHDYDRAKFSVVASSI